MNSRFALIVVGILIIVSMAVTADLGMRRPQEILAAEKAELEEFARSILDWETVLCVVPKVAGYEVHQYTAIRGKPAIVIIDPDSSLLWLCERGVSESGPDVPGGFRDLSVGISLFESEAAIEEEISRNVWWGFNVQQEGSGYHWLL
jgi:hypothetical protein